ncbi:hypothetical protein A2U01_0105212, partial [Trifolium medium]|nr:hypothetical protein [Trifolium medium]
MVSSLVGGVGAGPGDVVGVLSDDTLAAMVRGATRGFSAVLVEKSCAAMISSTIWGVGATLVGV